MNESIISVGTQIEQETFSGIGVRLKDFGVRIQLITSTLVLNWCLNHHARKNARRSCSNSGTKGRKAANYYCRTYLWYCVFTVWYKCINIYIFLKYSVYRKQLFLQWQRSEYSANVKTRFIALLICRSQPILGQIELCGKCEIVM